MSDVITYTPVAINNGRFTDLTGKKFGRLTVLQLLGNRNGRAHWLCHCECGEERAILGTSVVQGKTVSCGCAKNKHGMSRTKAYALWQSMLERCGNPNYPGYANYGGRGISVCDRWRDFETFYSDMGERPGGMSLDRRDNEKGYSPDNCRWASRKEQLLNRRNTLELTYQGRTQSLLEWSQEIGLPYPTLRHRIRAGWNVERALTQPSKRS